MKETMGLKMELKESAPNESFATNKTDSMPRNPAQKFGRFGPQGGTSIPFIWLSHLRAAKPCLASGLGDKGMRLPSPPSPRRVLPPGAAKANVAYAPRGGLVEILVIGLIAHGVDKLNCTSHGSRQPCEPCEVQFS